MLKTLQNSLKVFICNFCLSPNASLSWLSTSFLPRVRHLWIRCNGVPFAKTWIEHLPRILDSIFQLPVQITFFTTIRTVMSSFKIRAKTSSGWIISTSVLYICRRRHDCHALSKLKSYLYMLHLSVIAKTRYVIGEIQVLFVLQVLKQLP